MVRASGNPMPTRPCGGALRCTLPSTATSNAARHHRRATGRLLPALRLASGNGLAPRQGGGLGAASQSWRGWTPHLPAARCLRTMPLAWLQRSVAFGSRPWGRPAALRSREPASRAAPAWPRVARPCRLVRPCGRMLATREPAPCRRRLLLLAPAKRVPASKSSRGGGLRPPLRDRRPWGRLALGDAPWAAGASLVAPPARSQPAWGGRGLGQTPVPGRRIGASFQRCLAASGGFIGGSCDV